MSLQGKPFNTLWAEQEGKKAFIFKRGLTFTPRIVFEGQGGKYGKTPCQSNSQR